MNTRVSYARFAAIFGAVVIVAVVLTALLAVKFSPQQQHCNYYCGPKTGPRIANPATYHSTAYGFEFDYPPAWTEQANADDVTFAFQDSQGFSGTFNVYATRTPSTSDALMEEHVGEFPSSQFHNVYRVDDIRGAQIGFVSGVGAVYTADFVPAGGDAVEVRIIAMVVEHNGVQVTVTGVSPYTTDAAAAPTGIVEAVPMDYALTNFRWS